MTTDERIVILEGLLPLIHPGHGDVIWLVSELRRAREHLQRIADGEFCTVECYSTVHTATATVEKPCKHASCAKWGLG